MASVRRIAIGLTLVATAFLAANIYSAVMRYRFHLAFKQRMDRITEETKSCAVVDMALRGSERQQAISDRVACIRKAMHHTHGG